MTTEDEREKAAAEQRRSQEPDEVEASISAIEKALALPPLARSREAIRKLGCRIVAQALGKK
jgi:hypothetical protein